MRRVEAVPVLAHATDGSHRQSPSRQKTVGQDASAVFGRAAEPAANIACVSSQRFIHTMRQRTLERQNVSATSFPTECRLDCHVSHMKFCGPGPISVRVTELWSCRC